jgi:ubiquinone biosynthesis accessory factor UbiJ
MPIKPLLIAALETALNRYLVLDNNKEVLLLPLKAKSSRWPSSHSTETLYLCPTSVGIQIIDKKRGHPDTAITGSAWALGLMGFNVRPMRWRLRARSRSRASIPHAISGIVQYTGF